MYTLNLMELSDMKYKLIFIKNSDLLIIQKIFDKFNICTDFINLNININEKIKNYLLNKYKLIFKVNKFNLDEIKMIFNKEIKFIEDIYNFDKKINLILKFDKENEDIINNKNNIDYINQYLYYNKPYNPTENFDETKLNNNIKSKLNTKFIKPYIENDDPDIEGYTREQFCCYKSKYPINGISNNNENYNKLYNIENESKNLSNFYLMYNKIFQLGIILNENEYNKIKEYNELGFNLIKIFNFEKKNINIIKMFDIYFNKYFNNINEINSSIKTFENTIKLLNKNKNNKKEDILKKKVLNYIKKNYKITDNTNEKIKASELCKILEKNININIEIKNSIIFRNKLYKYLVELGIKKKRFSSGIYYYGLTKKHNKFIDLSNSPDVLYKQILQERSYPLLTLK